MQDDRARRYADDASVRSRKVDKDKVSLVATDEHSGYQYLGRWQGLPHETSAMHKASTCAASFIQTTSNRFGRC